MPYKNPNSPEAKASAKRRQERYRQTAKGKEARTRGRKKWIDKPENKEKIKQYQAEYRKTPEYHKMNTIYKWRDRGLIETDQYTYDELYEACMCCSECEECNKTFKNSSDRCMDHSHSTGEFRNFLCKSCNTKRG